MNNFTYFNCPDDFGYIFSSLDYLELPLISDKCVVSVVIPTYNEEKNIIKTLKFLRDQNFNRIEFEIIIVDNNSTDKTIDLINNFITNNLTFNIYCIKELQQGVSSARKRGYDEIAWRCKARGYGFNHLILSTDADIEEMPKDWIKIYYQKFIEEDCLGLFIGQNNFDFKNLNINTYSNIIEFLKIRNSLKGLMNDYFIDKGDGGDMGFSLNSYLNVGGIKILYYLENKNLFQTPTDDWNLSIDFIRNQEKISFVDSGLFVSPRKFLSSIKEVLNGTLYRGNWEILSKNQISNIDISHSNLIRLLSNQIRGIIAYRILLSMYIDMNLIFKEKNISFLGENLVKDIFDKIIWAKKIFPRSYYDDDISYFVPSRYLYFYFGERIHNLLLEKFNIPIFKKIKYLKIGEGYINNKGIYDQFLAQLANKTSLLEPLFAEF